MRVQQKYEMGVEQNNQIFSQAQELRVQNNCNT